MLNFIKFLDGLYVLKKAQMMDTVEMKRNSFYGKVKGVGMPTNILLCMVMDQPTQVPIATPENDDEITKMNASYMNNLVMMPLVNPMDLITEISLHCSYRFPVMDDESEKKQMNIVIEMTTLKMVSNVFSAYM